jgi:hypothetical protein
MGAKISGRPFEEELQVAVGSKGMKITPEAR